LHKGAGLLFIRSLTPDEVIPDQGIARAATLVLSL